MEREAYLDRHPEMRPKEEEPQGVPCHCGCGEVTLSPEALWVRGHNIRQHWRDVRDAEEDALDA
jgi:hypothetical protein